MSEVTYYNDIDVALIPVGATGLSAIVTQQPPRPTSPKVSDETSSSDMAPWGDNNDFPTKVIEDVRKDPEIGTLLDKAARLLYSGGLTFGTLDYDDNGNEKLLKVQDNTMRSDIIRWLVQSNIPRYILEGSKDLYYFANAFPEVVLNVGRDKIVQLCIQAAEQCRWQKQDSNGVVRNCYINANFPDKNEKDKTTKTLPVIDPYYSPAESLRQVKKGNNFIYPLSYPSPGTTYYQVADWNAIRTSGYLSISQAIPKSKLAYLDKQLNIKYHIEISNLYWEFKFPGFKSKPPAEQTKIKVAEFKIINEMLTGAENAGNSLVTPIHHDPQTGKEIKLWIINVIDDKIKQGQFLEDGKDASMNKYAAIGLHPALVGTMPNNGMGGAGSNIREAYNLHMMMIRAHQDILLEPLNSLVKYYNRWDENIVFRFRNSLMTTLDAGKEVKPKPE